MILSLTLAITLNARPVLAEITMRACYMHRGNIVALTDPRPNNVGYALGCVMPNGKTKLITDLAGAK